MIPFLIFVLAIFLSLVLVLLAAIYWGRIESKVKAAIVALLLLIGALQTAVILTRMEVEFPVAATMDTLRPAGYGVHTGLYDYPEATYNWEKVDDTGSGDGDTTYVYDEDPNSNDWDYDLYNIPDIDFCETDEIIKITVYVRCKKDVSGGSPAGRTIIYTHATEYRGTTNYLTTTYTLYSKEYADNPNTNQPWTQAEIADLQIGVDLLSIHVLKPTEVTAYARCTQIYVEVEYEAPPDDYVLLPVDYNSTETGWSTDGDNPYLDIKDGYVTSLADNQNFSWLFFEKSNATFAQAFLEVEAWKELPTQGGTWTPWIYNTTDVYDLGDYEMTDGFKWFRIDISDYIAWGASTCNVAVKFQSHESGFYSLNIRQCFISLWNSNWTYRDIFNPEFPVAQDTLEVCWKFRAPAGDTVHKILFSQNASGSWAANQSVTISAVEGWGNFSFTTCASYSSFVFKYWVNATTSGRWSVTNENQTLVQPLYFFDPTYVETTGLNSSVERAIRHSYGRKMFETNGSYVLFMCNGSHMLEYFNLDGAGGNWVYKEAVRDNIQRMDYAYAWLWYNKSAGGDVWVVYVTTCRETEGADNDVMYRMGDFDHSDGDITWRAAWQTVHVFPDADEFGATEGVIANATGYPFILVGNFSQTANGHQWLYHSSTIDGTWTTASGYPVTIETYTAGSQLQVFPDGSVSVQYVSWPSGKNFTERVWNVTTQTLGGRVNISDTVPVNYRFFSTTIDPQGNIHAAYTTGNYNVETIRYSYKDYATGTWTIKEEVVAADIYAGVSGGIWGGFPVLCYDESREEITCSWVEEIEGSGWSRNRNSSGLWEPRLRLFNILDPDNARLSEDPNICTPVSYSGTIMYAWQQTELPYIKVYTYRYTIGATALSQGNNKIHPDTADVGKTLGQVNQSLYLDSIQFDWIVYYSDAEVQQGLFVNGYAHDASVTISDTDDWLFIFCDAAGTWYHVYP